MRRCAIRWLTSILLCLGLSLVPARAATITAKTDLFVYCDMTLKGEITAGDVERLAEAYEQARRYPKIPGVDPKLCLDSLGGNYDEGLRLIEWLMRTRNITTVVDRGAQCYSACALLFMFGNHSFGDGMISPRRKIHVKAKLGFHTPHITPTVDSSQALLSAKAYRAGIRAIGRLLEVDWDDWFPKTLLIEALKKEPEEFLFVDTVAKAASWDIDVIGVTQPNFVSDAMLEQACLNAARRPENKWSKRWWGVSEKAAAQREEITASARPVSMQTRHHRATFKGFGSEDSYLCIADIYNVPRRGLMLDITFATSANDEGVPPLSEVKTVLRDGLMIGTPIFYMFPSSARLSELGD